MLGLLGPERRGQDHRRADAHHAARPDGGTARVLGVDVAERPAAGAGHHRPRRASTPRSTRTSPAARTCAGRQAHAPAGVGRSAPAPTSCSSTSRSTHAADRVARTYSGGMRRRLDLAAALVHRAAGAVPRRAHHRPRPAGPQRAVGRDRGPRRRRHHRAAHHAVPRGGRHARRQHRGHRPRLRDRRGHRHRAQGTARGHGDRGRASATTTPRRAPPSCSRRSAPSSRDGKLVRVSVPGGDGAGSMLEAVRVLDAARLEPATLVLREPTLDDVFLELTGHAAETTTATTRDGTGSTGDGRRAAR